MINKRGKWGLSELVAIIIFVILVIIVLISIKRGIFDNVFG